MLIVNAALVALFAFRCIVTFSRGGMITGLIMMALLLLLMYRVMSTPAKLKIVLITGATVFAAVLIWGYTSVQTSGLLDKRYANQNARGVQKESFLTGRELLIKSELSMFLDHPFFGVGVGKNKEIRLEETGVKAASHNEVTRLLGEHGSLGLIALFILFFTPIILYFSNQSQIFALIFMVFWLLTISHAAMRIAAPAFVYSLALLRVKFLEE
jgi:O-antigen ligase